MKMPLIALGLALVATQAGAASEWMTSFVASVKSERVVLDALWPEGSRTVFWVSVKDTGTRRDGLAEYFCMLRKASGVPAETSFLISIYDAAAMDRGDFEKLGQYRCR